MGDGSLTQPLLSADTGLPKNPLQQVHTDLLPMWIPDLLTYSPAEMSG